MLRMVIFGVGGWNPRVWGPVAGVGLLGTAGAGYAWGYRRGQSGVLPAILLAGLVGLAIGLAINSEKQ